MHECVYIYIFIYFFWSDNFSGETWKKAAFIVQISRHWGQKMFQSSFHACFLFSLQIMIHKADIHKQPLINVSLHVGIVLFCCSKSMNWKRKQCPATIILHPKAFFYCGKKAKLITLQEYPLKAPAEFAFAVPTALGHKGFSLKHQTVEDHPSVVLFLFHFFHISHLFHPWCIPINFIS